MRRHGTAPLPFPGFFFERAAIFTSAAEDICNLWNEACKHSLKRKTHIAHTTRIRQKRHTSTTQQRRRPARVRDVSYAFFDARKDDSYTGRGRVAAQGGATTSAARQSSNSRAEVKHGWSGENDEFTS